MKTKIAFASAYLLLWAIICENTVHFVERRGVSLPVLELMRHTDFALSVAALYGFLARDIGLALWNIWKGDK